MKRLSFKMKITLWYTCVMAFLVAGLFAFLLSTSRYYTVSSMQNNLREVVTESIVELEYDDGTLEIDDDFQIFKNGIYLSAYDENKVKIFGSVPSDFSDLPELSDDTMVKTNLDGENWYIYDLYMKIEGDRGIWLRGIASQAEVTSAYQNTITVLLLVFPVFILLVGFLGYVFTKRALRPVRRIYDAAMQISTGTDLSIRIPNAGESDQKMDELAQLASVFNKMLERIEQAFEQEKQFTQDASHELRTPTTVIISQAECALEQAETLEEAKQNLAVILRQGEKMAGLISQLLTLSRADSGQCVLDIEEINLSELVELVSEEMKEEAEKKSIAIKTEITENLMMQADETLMMRLWMNLIQNAIQYGRENGMIFISLMEQEDKIIGRVKDNGIGISKEHLPLIWNRFYQADGARNRSESGSMGLGLSMVKWIVEAHNGAITVESNKDDGTEFMFEFSK